MKERSHHHRRPVSLGGTSAEKNISNVSVTKHRAWHILFGNRCPQDIATYINAVWLDTRYKFVCVERERIHEDRRQLKLNLDG
jgi:hypothetical protein